MVYGECTRHHRCSLRKISQTGEVKSALPDLDSLLLALVLIILAESLPLGLSRLRAHLSKVTRAPTLDCGQGELLAEHSALGRSAAAEVVQTESVAAAVVAAAEEVE